MLDFFLVGFSGDVMSFLAGDSYSSILERGDVGDDIMVSKVSVV